MTAIGSSAWGWLDDSASQRPPAPVVSLRPRPRPVPAVVIAPAAGGAGASVLSVLAADALAAAGHPVQWLSLISTAGCDALTRLTTAPAADESSSLTPAGARLHETGPDRVGLREALELTAPPPAAVVVDAGSFGAVRWQTIGDARPVLVIAARPDTANRSRGGALMELANCGALGATTVVICCLDPWAADAVGHRLTQALADRVGAVVLWDYDPHLGSGGPIDPTSVSEQTRAVVAQIAGLS